MSSMNFISKFFNKHWIVITLISCASLCILGFYAGRVDAQKGLIHKSVIHEEAGSVLFYYRWPEGDQDDVVIDCAGGGYYHIRWEEPGFRFWLLQLPTWNTCEVNKDVYYWPRIEFKKEELE